MSTKKFTHKLSRHSALICFISLLFFWELMGQLGALPLFVLPSPSEIASSFYRDKHLLLAHSLVTLEEAAIGLGLGIIIAFFLAIIMDYSPLLRNSIYPLLVLSQTIPTVALAPILVLWLGYGMTPKIVLIVLTTTFPIVISLMDGFRNSDEDAIVLLRLMQAKYLQIMWHVKLPNALTYFFAGLRVSVSYAFIAAVVSEWLGGFEGLGVYMTRVKKAFLYDSMFAVIFLIAIISLLSMEAVKFLEKVALPWRRIKFQQHMHQKGDN